MNTTESAQDEHRLNQYTIGVEILKLNFGLLVYRLRR